ncbi:hypothetical protein DFJ74DRAFT_121067 [Hyaloraphidium curvatum]|nr:hypothetical protein DFJ74DRAFT_121067 [Hyaloraphidium curvatum]
MVNGMLTFVVTYLLAPKNRRGPAYDWSSAAPVARWLLLEKSSRLLHHDAADALCPCPARSCAGSLPFWAGVAAVLHGTALFVLGSGGTIMICYTTLVTFGGRLWSTWWGCLLGVAFGGLERSVLAPWEPMPAYRSSRLGPVRHSSICPVRYHFLRAHPRPRASPAAPRSDRRRSPAPRPLPRDPPPRRRQHHPQAIVGCPRAARPPPRTAAAHPAAPAQAGQRHHRPHLPPLTGPRDARHAPRQRRRGLVRPCVEPRRPVRLCRLPLARQPRPPRRP